MGNKKKKVTMPKNRNPYQAQLFDPSCRAARKIIIDPNKKVYSRKAKHKNEDID